MTNDTSKIDGIKSACYNYGGIYHWFHDDP